MREFRRYAIVSITATAGVLSPPTSLMVFALAGTVLYESLILVTAYPEQ